MYTPLKITEWETQIITALESDLGQSTPLLKRAFNRVLAKVLAGVCALLDRRILWAIKQTQPQTCDADALAYMEDKLGITPSPAVAAILQVAISGDEDAYANAGTLWTIDGLVYSQIAKATISGGTASAQVECLTAGSASTLSISDTLSLVSPVAGITSAAVSSVVVEGQDADTLEERRAQVLARMQRSDEIGTAGYYISKALEVSGIAFARVTRNSGGDVVVYPLLAKTGSSRIPDATMLATVQTYLQDLERKPLAANVYALGASERTANVTIAGASPSDAVTKAIIEAAISAYLYAAYPRQYGDEADPTDIVSLGGLWQIIVAAGATATGVTLDISGIGSGVTSYTLPIGEIIKLGSVIWA